MDHILVLYRSRYGATRQYAQWIAKLLGAELCDQKKARPEDLQGYDIIIYGGGLYAGGVSGLGALMKHYSKIRDKKLVIFTVGIADPQSEANVAHIREGLSTQLPAQAQHIRIFHFRGGLDYGKLSLAHRAMMGMLKRMLAKKPPGQLTEEDRQMLATYGQKVDFAEEASVLPLVDYVNSLRGCAMQ